MRDAMEIRVALWLLFGYLLGSIPFGVLVARRRGIDLRQVGSRNIGATNAARALGRGWGALVLGLDAGKAALPVLLCGALWAGHPQRLWLQVAVASAAFLGHLYSIFLGFAGGKGVAAAFGAFLALLPQAALLGLMSYALGYGLSRMSSVGSLCAVLLFPLWLYLFDAPRPLWAFCGLVLVLVPYRHRGNIRRLLRREERRV